MNFDLLITGGEVVKASNSEKLDLGVRDGKIVEVAPSLSASASRRIDTTDKLIFPGFIDPHTHMGIPIMNTISADDFASGSQAAAFGGVTTILDFTVQEPGQSIKEALEIRKSKAGGKCHIDYGIHVNVTDRPEKWLHQIPKLIEEGFTSFKVFSTYRQAGMMATWPQFREILKTVDENGGLLMLHAEDNDLVESLTEENIREKNWPPIYHARSRPPEAEAKAIRKAAQIAGELDARLYIVHLSSRAGLQAALKAREQGVKLFLETCPQYLLLTEREYSQPDGHYFITTPALRTKADGEALWQALRDGEIDTVGTDHCPFTSAQKNAGAGQFHRTPNGLPGVETLFPLLYTHGVQQGRLRMERLVNILAKNAAHIFGLAHRKGEIRVGADADLVIWNPNVETEISAKNMHGKADWSPYEGLRVAGQLEYTIVRGRILAENGKFYDNVKGELLLSEASGK